MMIKFFLFFLFLNFLILSCDLLLEQSLDESRGVPNGVPFHYKVFRANKNLNSNIIKNSNYAYAPNIILTKDNVLHQFYCGDSFDNPGGLGGDKILYTKSTDGGLTWTNHRVLHYSVYKAPSVPNEVEYHWQTCDPSVIYYPPHKKWYLYYSGSYARKDANGKYNRPHKTLVFVARSETIDGEYATLTENGWSTNNSIRPKPIMEPFEKGSIHDEKPNQYGAGQTTLYFDGVRMHLWHTDTTDDPDHPELNGKSKIYKRLGKPGNPIEFGGPIYTGVIASSVEVKRDMKNNRFVMIYIDSTHRPGSQLLKRYSYDNGITWPDRIVSTNHVDFPDYSSNAGISSDLFGNLLPGVYEDDENFISKIKNKNFVGYGAPIDPIFTDSVENEYKDPSRSRWDLYISQLNIDDDEPCQLTYQTQFVKFTKSWSNSSLWPHSNLIDNNLSSAYSSYPSSTIYNLNDGKYQVALWADKKNPVKSLMLHPRVDKNMTTEEETLWAFPQEYDIWNTDSKNTKWLYLGRYKTQPVEVTIDKNGKKYNKVFSAKIDFKKKINTWGFLIKPVVLGADKHGGLYFQLGEIQAELWRYCN